VLQQTHAWARFGKGAWREVRIITESFDDQGHLTNSNTTDNKTTIEEITPERVTLRVDITVEIAGRRVPSPPQIIKQGYAGENVGQTVAVKPLGTDKLLIEGREIPCESQQIEVLGGLTKEITQVSYAPQAMPVVLKRKSMLIDTANSKTTQETLTEVLSLDMSHRVLDETELRTAFWERMVQKNDRGTTTTWSIHVPEIPGEVVYHSSKKQDSTGHLVRRSTLELVGYGIESPDFANPAMPRRRHKRGR